jgi:hypothetical protein
LRESALPDSAIGSPQHRQIREFMAHSRAGRAPRRGRARQGRILRRPGTANHHPLQRLSPHATERGPLDLPRGFAMLADRNVRARAYEFIPAAHLPFRCSVVRIHFRFFPLLGGRWPPAHTEGNGGKGCKEPVAPSPGVVSGVEQEVAEKAESRGFPRWKKRR